MATTKSKFNFRSIVRYSPAEAPEPKSLLKSKTVPNDAMTIKEILVKYANGLYPAELERDGTYDPDVTFDTPDLEKLMAMDIHDRELYANQLAAQVAQAKQKLDYFHQQEAKLKAEKEKEEVEDKLLLRKLRRTGKETPRKGDNAGGSQGGSEANDDSND